MKSLKMGINCVLRSRCTCCMTLNQDILLHLFPGYYLMGLSREQGCDKIEWIGSKNLLELGWSDAVPPISLHYE